MSDKPTTSHCNLCGKKLWVEGGYCDCTPRQEQGPASEKPTEQLLSYRGYTIEIGKGFDGWGYSVAFGMKNLGHFVTSTYDRAKSKAMELIDDNITQQASEKPTTQDLILLEVRDLTASLGELRIQLNGVWQRVVALEGRVRNLESGPSPSVGIQGLDMDDIAWSPVVDLHPENKWQDGDCVTVVYDGKTMHGEIVAIGDGAYELREVEA